MIYYVIQILSAGQYFILFRFGSLIAQLNENSEKSPLMLTTKKYFLKYVKIEDLKTKWAPNFEKSSYGTP